MWISQVDGGRECRRNICVNKAAVGRSWPGRGFSIMIGRDEAAEENDQEARTE
jgi:hypothetical protein